MKAIIIEDEEPARDLLKHYLAFDKGIELIGEFADGFSGLMAINNEKPDLVFLDIQLPKLNGFEILELIEVMPQIIFTTAYDEFAIRAFDLNATDYLLKPYAKERFLQALSRAKERFALASQGNEQEYKDLKEVAYCAPMSRIVVKDNKGIHIIALDDVFCIEAQDDYVFIHTSQGRYMKKQTMKSLQERLSPNQFIRVHRSFIANILQIERIEPYEKDSFVAVLKNGMRIRVSTSGYKILREQLNF